MALQPNQREEFEKWAVAHTYNITKIDASGVTIYKELETRCAWQAWWASYDFNRKDSMYLD